MILIFSSLLFLYPYLRLLLRGHPRIIARIGRTARIIAPPWGKYSISIHLSHIYISYIYISIHLHIYTSYIYILLYQSSYLYLLFKLEERQKERKKRKEMKV